MQKKKIVTFSVWNLYVKYDLKIDCNQVYTLIIIYTEILIAIYTLIIHLMQIYTSKFLRL